MCPSPSTSAKAGADHTRCGMARGVVQSSVRSAEAPVSPSKAKTRRPKATTTSGDPSPSMSMLIGGETAISSLSFPAPRCKSRVNSVVGFSSLMSVQPNMPLRLKLKADSEYHVTQHKRSSTPSPVVSTGSGGVSAYPFCARKLNTSVVEVSSIPINLAPLPESRLLASVGTVMIISGAWSVSSWAITGPGSLRRGASESESVPWTANLSQSKEPESPSIFQTHMFPEFESTVVRTTAVVEPSSCTHVGSEGWVPRSNVTSQMASVGVLVVISKAMTFGVGSLAGSSTTATTSSGEPSSSKSARTGWVTASWPLLELAKCGDGEPIRMSLSL